MLCALYSVHLLAYDHKLVHISYLMTWFVDNCKILVPFSCKIWYESCVYKLIKVIMQQTIKVLLNITLFTCSTYNVFGGSHISMTFIISRTISVVCSTFSSRFNCSTVNIFEGKKYMNVIYPSYQLCPLLFFDLHLPLNI